MGAFFAFFFFFLGFLVLEFEADMDLKNQLKLLCFLLFFFDLID